MPFSYCACAISTRTTAGEIAAVTAVTRSGVAAGYGSDLAARHQQSHPAECIPAGKISECYSIHEQGVDNMREAC